MATVTVSGELGVGFRDVLERVFEAVASNSVPDMGDLEKILRKHGVYVYAPVQALSFAFYGNDYVGFNKYYDRAIIEIYYNTIMARIEIAKPSGKNGNYTVNVRIDSLFYCNNECSG